MNWEAIGAMGELIGAVAVVATLAYLAIQIRQNTRSMEVSRAVEMGRFAQMRTQQRLGLSDSILESEVLLGVFSRTRDLDWPALRQVLDDLSPIEREAFSTWHRKQALIIENIHTVGQSGLIDQELIDNLEPIIRHQAPVWKELDSLAGLRPSFIEKVEQLTREE